MRDTTPYGFHTIAEYFNATIRVCQFINNGKWFVQLLSGDNASDFVGEGGHPLSTTANTRHDNWLYPDQETAEHALACYLLQHSG